MILTFRLQIPQQTLKRPLIRIVILPPAEIADVPGAPNIYGPRLVGFHTVSSWPPHIFEVFYNVERYLYNVERHI